MRKLKKTLYTFIAIIIVVGVVGILLISPISKYLIEKYDEEYTGRQITIGWAYVNPFTGYAHFSDVRIHEFKSDSIFLSMKGLSTNISLLKLFDKTYEFTEVTLNHPRGYIIQNDNKFNFQDLIEKFSSRDSMPRPDREVHLSILNIKINNGDFFYRENITPIDYSIVSANFESPGFRWDVDTISTKFYFLPGIGSGEIKGEITINVQNSDYRLAAIANKFDLQILQQYLRDISNYGTFSANLDADIRSSGNFKDKGAANTSGMLAVNDFHFGKNPDEDYASFDKLVIAIEELNPREFIYSYDSLTLHHPYFDYQLYDHLDNIQTLFGADGANIEAANANDSQFNLILEIADYVKTISRNFFRSNYKIDHLAIYDGDFTFSDFSLSEKFSAGLSSLNITADSIDKSNNRVHAHLWSDIRPYGKVKADLSINPKDSTDFDIRYNLQDIPAAMFNPYTISYTSFPLDRGTIAFNGTWNVSNGMIRSDNHMLIIDPRTTRRIRNKDTKWVPMPLIMSFVRERGNVIDYEIPITGNLKDPNFHFSDVLSDLFTNIFVKPPTTFYRLQVKNIETKIEKSLALNWKMNSSVLYPDQEKFLEKISDFMKKSPEAVITVTPQVYKSKEMEYILYFEAKKKYYLLEHNTHGQILSQQDSASIDKMSVKDSSFVRYLNHHINDSLLFTIEEKCARYVDESVVEKHFQQLSKSRENVFLSFFQKNDVENRIKITHKKDVIPYNGFTTYQLDYNGDFPETLVDAYREMSELNDKAPRNKFKKERKKKRF